MHVETTCSREKPTQTQTVPTIPDRPNNLQSSGCSWQVVNLKFVTCKLFNCMKFEPSCGAWHYGLERPAELCSESSDDACNNILTGETYQACPHCRLVYLASETLKHASECDGSVRLGINLKTIGRQDEVCTDLQRFLRAHMKQKKVSSAGRY